MKTSLIIAAFLVSASVVRAGPILMYAGEREIHGNHCVTVDELRALLADGRIYWITDGDMEVAQLWDEKPGCEAANWPEAQPVNVLEYAEGPDWTRTELNASHLPKLLACGGRYQFDHQKPGDYSTLRLLMVNTGIDLSGVGGCDAPQLGNGTVPPVIVPEPPPFTSEPPLDDLVPIPEPASLALVGIGLFVFSRTMKGRTS